MAADWFKVARNHKNAEVQQASKRFFFEKKNQKTLGLTQIRSGSLR